MGSWGEFFLLGLTMSYGPCVAFCSPVILSYIASTKRGWKQGAVTSVAFCFSRFAGHLLLGVVAGIAGSAVSVLFSFPDVYLYVPGGFFVASIGLLIVAGKTTGHNVCRNLRKKKIDKGIAVPVVMGFMAGVMPCLPLMGVVGYIAFTSQSWLDGLLYGTAFGAGTLFSPVIPLGVLSAVIPHKLFKTERVYFFVTRVCGVLLIIMGLHLMFGKSFL
ncbi:sulfite exporter TauE/SafE family protein [Chitinispirillales bacterium ANBcel5]|uniref:urease accessory protein UreH domain-containing protein n=1 Tax=Cellulosispirillum alkaliphilum TaxID=3039283 RepID=UPI002A58D719|nr:sulfite exporter TauE/SafE family protein [Chitinispirillales bacterium ANBcel5]